MASVPPASALPATTPTKNATPPKTSTAISSYSSGVGRSGRQYWNENDLEAILGVLESCPPLTAKDWEAAAESYKKEYCMKTG